MLFNLPSYVKQALAILNEAGFEAYVVGGAVRDMILDREPEDYDIVTNARPDEIQLLAEKNGIASKGEVGKDFGVVLLVVEKHTIEVASYRNEIYGADSHRPAEVWYCDKLSEDLGRRDFTINAMAMSSDGELIDIYNGQEDLRNKVLRTVGNPEKRFDEDALRMFRACRFVAQLGFAPDDSIKRAIKRNLERVRGLSLERVRMELDKLLVGNYVAQGLELMTASELLGESCRLRKEGEYINVPILPEILKIVGVPQNPEHHLYDVWGHTLEAMKHSDGSLEVAWAILLHDIAKGKEGVRKLDENGQPTDHGHEKVGAEMAADILRRLGYNKEFITLVCWLIGNHMHYGVNIDRPNESVLKWVRRTAREGPFRITKDMAEAFKKLVAVCVADMAACNVHEQEVMSAQIFGTKLIVMAYEMPVHTSDLNVSGKDIAEYLTKKVDLGTLMQILLRRVQDGNLKNTEAALMEAAVNWQARKEDI